jgi:hypothetical protein
MPKRRKKAAQADLATMDLLMAQEDVAAMRPALAVAPELVVQTLTRKRKRRPQRSTRKKAKGRKSSAKKVRQLSPKTKKKAKKAARRK